MELRSEKMILTFLVSREDWRDFLKLLLYHLSYLNTADNPVNGVRSQVCSELDKSYPTNLGSTNVKPKLHVGFI